MNHSQWARKATGESIRSIARTLNMDPSNLSRQMRRGLSSDLVIQISHAYNLNVIDALLETGHFRPQDDPRKNDQLIQDTIDYLRKVQERQSDYGLVADSSPDEGEGLPDDYEP